MSEKEDGNINSLPISVSISDFNPSDSTTVRRATSREKALTANELSYITQSSKEYLLELNSEKISIENGNENKHSELSSLLSNGKESENENSDDEEKEMERTVSRLNQWPAKLHIITELYRMAELALPAFFFYLILFSRFIISFVFIQWLGSRHLASASLSFSFCNATGYSILIGFSSSMDTIASQAYGGHNYKHIGLLFQKYVLSMVLLCIPLVIVWGNVENIFLMFNQDFSVSKEAGDFATWLIPDLIIQSILIPFQVFLRSQCVLKPMVVFSFLSLLSHIPFCYFFIFTMELGSKGAAIAIFFSSLLFLSLLTFYFLHSEVFNRCWQPWSIEIFREWKSMLSLALPSFLLTCLEWWVYEIFFVISGFLPTAFECSGVMAIILNIDSFFYLIFFTLSSITSTRIGMLLGSNSPASARHSAIIALGMSLILGVVVFVTILIFWSTFASFYAEPGLINPHLATSCLILAFVEIFNAFHTCAMGIFVGLSYQKLAVVIIIFAFYIMGLPLGGTLSFIFNFDVHGLLFGILFALISSCGLSLTILSKVDWIVECDRVVSYFSEREKGIGHVELSKLDDI